MKWEAELVTGTKYLNQNLREVNNDGVSIKVHTWNAQKKHIGQDSHLHDYYEVCYVLQGKGSYIEKNKSREIKHGSLILTPPEIEHQFTSELGMDIIQIGFNLQNTSHTYIQKLFNEVNRERLYILHDREEAAAILLWLSILKLASEDNTIYLKNNIDNLAITLFWSLLKEFEKHLLAAAPENQVRTSASLIIYRAKLYIIEHLAETLTMDRVANHLHLSERHLSRLFNQELGQSFSTFIRKERIRKAGILLSDSNIPIKDIAIQTGFSSVHYFTNVFSKEMDMPPGKFRDKFRHENIIPKKRT